MRDEWEGLLSIVQRFIKALQNRSAMAKVNPEGSGATHLYNVWADRVVNPWKLEPDGQYIRAIGKQGKLYRVPAYRTNDGADVVDIVEAFIDHNEHDYELTGALFAALNMVQRLHPVAVLSYIRGVEHNLSLLVSLASSQEEMDEEEPDPTYPDPVPLMNLNILKSTSRDN